MRTSVNGTELYFDVEGPELAIEDDALHRRPTIVVVHGGPGFDQGYLRPGLRPLTEVAQLVFIDLRGQGRSAPAAVESCTLEQMADDVAALCRQLGIERPTVFGHSAGGFVALQLAVRHPDVSAALILCDSAPTLAPIPDDDPPPSLAERAGPEAVTAAERLFAGDFSAATLQTFQRLVVPHYAAPTHTEVPGELMSLSTLSPDVAAYFFSELAARYDLRERLGEIAVPTLVIVGAYDWVCSPAASRAIADAIPGARLLELPDAGHFGFSETPGPFLRAVRAHLAAAAVARSTAA
jgi:proline iminopeptidase